jgi:hypothetical protein
MLTGSQRLTGRIFYDWNRTFLTAGLPVLHSSVNFHTYHVIANHTWTMSPSLLNTAQFTFGRVDLKRGPEPVLDGVTYQSLGVNANSDTPQFHQNFRGSVSGFWNMGQDNLVNIDRHTYQWTDTVSYTRGAHMVKFGGEVRVARSDRVTANLTDPQFTFDGRFTANPFGDFLIGRPARMNQGSLRQNEARSQIFSLFIQDDYKILRNLTLSFGLRWEPFFPFYDAGELPWDSCMPATRVSREGAYPTIGITWRLVLVSPGRHSPAGRPACAAHTGSSTTRPISIS